MTLLKPEFLDKYSDMPEHMSELSSFVFYRTYSRWLPHQKRRETWKEAVKRAVEYNVGISLDQFKRNNFEPPMDKISAEAETLFDNIFNLKQFLSGRTHWVGGAESKVADKFPLSNFNCAFIDVTKWEDLCDLFYMLLIGTGVGFKGSKENISNLPPIRTDYTLLHSEYNPLPKSERLEHTKITMMENGYAKIYVGDSKEGWVEALRAYLRILTEPTLTFIKHIKISYNSIRPKGERLVTFGGTASGYEPMRDMFEGIDKVFKGILDTTINPIQNGYIRPIHVLDIGNLIGNNVVVGGVRRTAELFLCDEDDWECILAKYGINGVISPKKHREIGNKLKKLGVLPDWWYIKEKLRLRQDQHHRRMSNNSIAFESKPSRENLNLIFDVMQSEGEPAFVNMEAAKRKRPNAKGLNPCGEVILDSYGVCNLTTVNVMGFVNDGVLDYQGLMQAQALSARAGIRMTCLDLELPHWDQVQKRDRLIGCSLTGWKDAMSALNYDQDQELNLLHLLGEIAHNEAIRYSYILRIPTPLLDTTIKPEGTLSQVAGGVSSGLHKSKAPCYIRRIRINAQDPLAQVAKRLNWTINPEVDTLLGEEPRTLVIDFPIKCPTTATQEEQTIEEQFDTYFKFQENYTAHNSSNTISVKPDEWDKCEQIVWDNWGEFIGVSFLAHDGGSYQLAPYETITEEEYDKLKSTMKPFDVKLLEELEGEGLDETSLDGAESCSTGACPIR